MRRACLVLALLAGVGASKLDHAARNNAFIGYTETKGQPCVVEDRDARCEQWASSGECTRNPGFMTSTCAKSCGAPCEPPEVDDRLTKHANVGAVVFHTAEGDIRVRLRKDASPIVAETFSSFAKKPGASGSFYRSEAVPEPGAIDNFGGPGPPYALVQGTTRRHPTERPAEGERPEGATRSRVPHRRWTRFFHSGGRPPGVGQWAHGVGRGGPGRDGDGGRHHAA